MAPVILKRLIDINYTAGRRGHRPLAIVVHVMEGTMPGTDAWFRDPENPAKSSAHFGVARNGTVVQWVDTEDSAHHAGLVRNPTSRLIRSMPGVNPNYVTLGIEHEGRAQDTLTIDQALSSSALIRDLAARYEIPLDREHIIGHREIRADKLCPGAIDVDLLLSLAQEKPLEGAPKPGERRWSRFYGEAVVLTKYIRDDDWYFLRESELKGVGHRAETPWSQMPTEP